VVLDFVRPPGEEDVVLPIFFEKGDENGGPSKSWILDAGFAAAGQNFLDLSFHF
jgi:hypothetical protein